jgi:hypothetical protein
MQVPFLRISEAPVTGHHRSVASRREDGRTRVSTSKKLGFRWPRQARNGS